MFEFLNSPDFANFFGALGGMGDAVGSIIGATALLYSMMIYKESIMLSHYSELDATYASLLEKAIEHTHFVAKNPNRSEEESTQYDLYAFMVWNFLETVSDRCKNNKSLNETWSPVVLVEAKKHQAWFMKPENKDKFKESFRNEMLVLLQAQKPIQPETAIRKAS